MRGPVALLIALLLVPSASAAITLDEVTVPERTAADKAFPVQVTLTNTGPARTVHLFGALYDREDGRGACGSTADPRFRTFTHVVQDPIDLPANARTEHPAPGQRWLHRYATKDATPAAEDAQFCVFVANASSGALINYETFKATTLSVRGKNTAPVVDFTLDPEAPRALVSTTLQAQGSDAENDPLTYRWDFGHEAASGRATGEGAIVDHIFYPSGDFIVTLTASDGIDETRVSHLISVSASQAVGDPAKTPLGLAWVLAGTAIGLLLRTKRT